MASFENKFEIDGRIEFLDNSENKSKTEGKEFLVRSLGLDRPDSIGGNEFPNKLKFQLTGNNCKRADEVPFNGDKYFLRPGDLVVITFGLSGMAAREVAGGTVKQQLAKQDSSKYPGNPTGMDYGITNLNCFGIAFQQGYVPKEFNKVGYVQQGGNQNQAQNNQTNSNSASNAGANGSNNGDDDLPF
jgi:hypothetical protein